jgi:hypothetical protein
MLPCGLDVKIFATLQKRCFRKTEQISLQWSQAAAFLEETSNSRAF